jgi:microcystin-dependent protein
MAERNPPSWLQAALHPAQNDRLLMRALAGAEGVLGSNDLKCTPGGLMTVTVAAGAAFINGTVTTEQGMYHVYNESPSTLPLTAAHATLARKDIVVAEIKDNTIDASGLNLWRIRVVTGTAAGSPVQPATPANSLLLALLDVPAADTTLDVSQITDLRVFAPSVGAAPTGMISAFWGLTIPFGWLACDGSAVSRSIYSRLFTQIGTTAGAGNGTTTFNVPDFRGRVPVGLDNFGANGDAGRLDLANTLGLVHGEQKHTQTAGELATHTHGITVAGGLQVVIASAATSTIFSSAGSNIDHAPAWNMTVANPAINNAGTSDPMNVMQPGLLVSYMIRF